MNKGGKGKEKVTKSGIDSEEFMNAVVVNVKGGSVSDPSVFKVVRVRRPKLKKDEVLIQVHFVGVNRPDIDARKCTLPGPFQILDKTNYEYLGLECSGIVVDHEKGLLKDDVLKKWPLGTRVCAILVGGGYAEYVAVSVGHLLSLPSRDFNMKAAATLPQVACTVWAELFMETRLDKAMASYGEKTAGSWLHDHETLLIHGGCSGIGLFALQMAKAKLENVTVFVTAGNINKLHKCEELGADLCINYNETDFVQVVRDATQNQGVDVILDCTPCGESYYEKNMQCLKNDGRLIKIGDCFRREDDCISRVGQEEFSFKSVIAGSLMHKTSEMRALVVKQVEEKVWPLIRSGKVKPALHAVSEFSFKKIARAHTMMEDGENIGKIVLAP